MSQRSMQSDQQCKFELDENFEIRPELCANLIRWFSLHHNQFFKTQKLALDALNVTVPFLTSIWDEITLY